MGVEKKSGNELIAFFFLVCVAAGGEILRVGFNAITVESVELKSHYNRTQQITFKFKLLSSIQLKVNNAAESCQ